MICKKCGNVVNGEKYCPYCGEKVEQEKREDVEINFNHVETKKSAPRQDNFKLPNDRLKFAITGFSLAMAALCLCVIPFVGIILAIPAFILSVIGASSLRLHGFGIAGAIVAPFALILSIIETVAILELNNLISRNTSAARIERKAESVFNSAKSVIKQSVTTGELTYKGVKISEDGINYSITVSTLIEIDMIDDNPFKTNCADGGMTVYYDKPKNEYSCVVTGTINGYNVEYRGYYSGFHAWKD